MIGSRCSMQPSADAWVVHQRHHCLPSLTFWKTSINSCCTGGGTRYLISTLAASAFACCWTLCEVKRACGRTGKVRADRSRRNQSCYIGSPTIKTQTCHAFTCAIHFGQVYAKCSPFSKASRPSCVATPFDPALAV